MPRIDKGPPGDDRAPPRARKSWDRKLGLIVLTNLVVFTVAGAVAEVGCRLFWHPRYWVHAEGWLVGSGQGRAGRKWWPSSSFRIESTEFHVRFQSDARGYRARPETPRTAGPFRIAFVGDSYTEAMQVDYDQTFVSLLERGLAARAGGRAVVAENYGVAATGVFDYWHRTIHDVFRADAPAPEALVLCVYPGNDFTDVCPDDGFDPDGRPKREYYGPPRWTRHALAWLGLKSKLAYFVQRTLHVVTLQTGATTLDAPPLWWNDPATAAAARDSTHVRHVRALMRALEDECDRRGTRLVVLIVPAHTYPRTGQSPLTRILADWGVRAPVLDVAAQALATPKPSHLMFPLDGHLNPKGHRYLTDAALGPLAAALGLDTSDLPARVANRTDPSAPQP